MWTEVKIPKSPIRLIEKFPGCWVPDPNQKITYYEFFEIPKVFSKMGEAVKAEDFGPKYSELVATELYRTDAAFKRIVDINVELLRSDAVSPWELIIAITYAIDRYETEVMFQEARRRANEHERAKATQERKDGRGDDPGDAPHEPAPPGKGA